MNAQILFTIPPHWQAAIWQIIACMCFALVNGLVRYLTGGSSLVFADPLPAATIVFFQNVFGTVFLLPLIYQNYSNPLKTKYMKLHLLRVTLAVLGVVLWYLALCYMPITQAVALNFTGPIVTIIGAYFLLNERLGVMRWLAVTASFIGSIFILRPDKVLFGQSTSIDWSAIIPLMSAVAFAGVKICSRMLATFGETPRLITTFLMVFMIPVSLVVALLYGFIWPSMHHWIYLIFLGFLATCAHMATSKAYATGEVTFIMPFGISKIVLSAAVGYWVFGEFPHMWTVWLGTAIIFLSILFLSYQNYLDQGEKKWAKATA